MLRSLLLSCAAVASLVTVVAACGSGDVALGSNAASQSSTHDGSTGSTSACQAAGGTCLATGGVSCTNRAPDSAQDCNPELLPSGSFCCLDPVDAGPGTASDAGCARPPSAEGSDGGTDQCSVAANVLTCKISGGVVETCLSDSLTECPDNGGQGDASSICYDNCAAGEYGVACSASAAPPGSYCHQGPGLGVTPEGTTFYCCACGG